MREKSDGINRREKFRIRYYNNDPSLIRLERKAKRNGLELKDSVVLTEEIVKKIIAGEYNIYAVSVEKLVEEPKSMKNFLGDPPDLLNEFLLKLKLQCLRPKTIVDYIREPYVYRPGNVRVTFDYHLRTGRYCTDFLNSECELFPVDNAPIIMEVKWDHFLPAVIQAAIQPFSTVIQGATQPLILPRSLDGYKTPSYDSVQHIGGQPLSFSKYARCRIYD